MENDSFELQGGAMLPEGMYAAAASVKGTPANVKSPRNDGINIANMSDEDLLSAINAPLTGEEVAVKMAELNNAGISINSSTISFDEFLAYDEWRKKQHFSFWGALGDGVATAAVDIGKGVGSALTDPKKLALAAGLGAIATPAAGITAAYGASLIEGFARGTRDLAGLVVMAANHPSSPLYRMFINPDGDKQQSYKDFLDLAEWNNSTEDILKGKSNAFMPDRSTYEKLLGRKLGGQVDDFIGVNNHLATAASYILDPTVFLTFGAGSASKGAAKAIAAKAGTAALKSGHVGSQVAGAVAATAARNQFKATWLNSVGEAMVKMGGLVSRPLEAGYEAISNTAEKVLGVKGHFAPTSGNFNVTRVNPSKGHAPQSFTHGVLGAAGIYSIFQIPYALPIASVYGVAKAVSYAGQALADLGKATSKTAGKGVAQIALHSSGAFGGYMAELAKTTLKGGMYGGVIGGLAAGEEGAAGGIGTGATLGAIGHNVGAIYGTVSGKFSMMQIQSEYKNRIKEYKDKGFILQAENMQKFYDDIAAEHGEEAAVRLAGQILTLEKGKNVSVALLSVDNMRNTLLMNPDFYTEVQLPQGQGAFGAGGRKKVLNDLGKLVLANGEAGGALWNGLFVEIDPKTGEVIRTPISQVRDRKTGRYHVVINIDAMRYARDENGNYIFDEIKGIERSEVRTRKPKTKEVDVTEEVVVGTETIEGPRRKMSASDPTVPKEDNTPVLVDEEGVPVEGETPTVEEEFVPADVARDRLVRARKSLVDQYGMSEAKGAIDKDGNVTLPNKNNNTAVILEKLTPEERIKVIKEHNKIASEYRAMKDVRVSKIEEIRRRHKKLSDANADDFAKKKITYDEFKKREEALLEKRDKEIEPLQKEYKDFENKRRAELATESLVDYILALPLEIRGEEMKQTLKFAEENPEHPQYNPQIIKRVKEILIEKGVMSKDGRFTKESTAGAKETPKQKEVRLRKELGAKEASDVQRLVTYTRKKGAHKNSFLGAWREWVKRKKVDGSLNSDTARHVRMYDEFSDAQKEYFSLLVENHYTDDNNISAGNDAKLEGESQALALLTEDTIPEVERGKRSIIENVNYDLKLRIGKRGSGLDGKAYDFTSYEEMSKLKGVTDSNTFVKGQRLKLHRMMEIFKERGIYDKIDPEVRSVYERIVKEEGFTETDVQPTKTEPAKKAPAPTPKAAPKAAQSKDIPARKQRVRSREIFGPARPLVIERKETRTTKKTVETGEFEDVVEIRETPATRKVPRIGGRVETATLSELYHLMNKVRRRVELGTEINSVVSRWLFGDANGEGWAFKDRAGAVAFMRAAYDKNIGPRGRNSQTAIDWKDAIDSYERDGKVDPRVQDAFDDFLEEIGESIFLGWESGKPFDYVFRGGDLGMVRNVVEALKDRMTNLFERNATNLGADINTKQAFFDWFKKNKSKFRADPHMETAFNDLIRIYQDKGMKNNGRTYRNLYTMAPAAVKEQAEYYGVEERIFQDAEGNWNWKSPERYNKDTHDNALLMVNELFDLANTDPEALNGLDFYIFSAEGMNPSGIEGQISKGFEALDKRSRSDFDPITQRTLDTQGVHAKGFLFSSADAKDIGPDFDDIQRAQISQTRQSGIYKQRPSIQEYGARGRPRTSLSGAMLADAMKAIAKGKRGKHLVVFRGIPTEKAFRIINKYVPKQVSKNVRLLAPIIADGGVSAPNVVNGQYLGFEQDQGGGMILDRSKGDAFSAREINFVPYEMEFRVTLRDPRNPQVDYKRPHFAFVTRAYDMDALNRRIHTIWNENLEVRQAYNNINDYIKHVHSTMSEYSGNGMIPAVKFFGADEYARERRKYVVAAIGAAPTKDVREFYFGDVLSAGEADFHETHYRNALESVNHPWMSLRLDNLNGASVVEGEGIPNIRVNEKMYRRGMIPTPTHDDSPLMEGMYSASDFDPEIRRQWEDAAMKGQFLSAKSFKMMDKIEKHGLKIQWMRSRGEETPRTWVDSQRRIKSNDGEEWLLNIGRGEIGDGEPFYSPLAYVHARLNNDGSVIIDNVITPEAFVPREEFIKTSIRSMVDYLQTYDEGRISEIKKQIESDEKWIKRVEKQSPKNSKNPNTEIFKHLEGIRSRIRSLKSELTKLEEVPDTSTEEARANLVFKNQAREYFLGRRQNISKSDVLNSKKLRDYYSEEWDRRTKSLYGFGSDNLGFLPEGLSRNDVITLLMAELSHRLGRMGGEIIKNKPAGGQFFSAGDGPIPLIVESIPDFHRSTEDGPFDYIKTIKNLSKPSRLIKTLNSHPIFNIKDKTFNFQPAEAFDARSLEEYDFLRSNFKWSEQKGDIFKSESVGRFVRMFGKDTTVVRHTLDEHLEVKNDTDTYNKNFATGKPVVFPVNYAEFKSEFFGPAYKGSNASTINAYVFSARQMTALNNMGNKDSSLRTLVGFSNPLVYDYKGEGKGSMPIERIHKMAVKNGHDGVIMQNVYEGGIIDTLVTVPKGKESNVLVLDRHLNDIPVPRNSGHPEGARVMFSSSDVPKLPEGAFGPNNPETVEISRGLKALKGMKTGDGKFIVRLNQDKSRKVGMEYETMKHDPYNPKVKAAYDALAKETEEQYQFILDAGYMPEMHMAPNEPYPNSRATIADLRERKRLKVFSTDYGYGETPITEKDIKENPMLRMSKYKDANGVPMRVNDLFRFVHDFFGHSERGNSFGPLGEENAWDVHARMFSPLARRAMTSETRGQNSWVNFIHEPNIEINRMRDTARRLEREGRFQEAMELRATIGSTRFADQKIGLMPEWTSKLDEELTPIESEMYGKHITSDANYGIYASAGDYPERIWSPTPEEFVSMSTKARSAHKYGTSVDVKNPADLAGYQLLVAGDGKAFAHVSPDGELGGVIRGLNGKSEDVVAVIEAALATKKVKWLSAFDTVLPEMYNAFGFEAVARMKFVDEYRPEGWDYSLYEKFNGGRPSVVFMSYVGGRAVPYRIRGGVLVGNYNDGVAIARSVSDAKFSAGDVAPDDGIPDPLTYDVSKLTPNSRDNLKVLDLLSQYRNVAKDLRTKIDAGQITEAQANMALNKWNKDNNTGHTAMSWSVHRTLDGEKKVYELTDTDIDTMRIDVIASDPVFKKEHSIAKQAYVAEKIRMEPPPEGLSNKEKIKWIAQRRFESKAFEYLRTLDDEQKEAIYRKYIPDFEAKQEAAGKEGLYSKKVKRLARRLFDKELAKLFRLRDEAEANGEPDPFGGVDSSSLEDIARENAVMEAVSQIDKIEQLDADDPLMEGDGDIGRYERALLESGLSKEEAKALVERRRRDVIEIAEEETKEVEIEVLHEGILKPLTLEDAIAEIKEENRKYFDENQENLWEPNEIEVEAQRRVNARDEIISTFSEKVYSKTGRKAMNPKSLEFMAKVEFANTKWFDKDGNSILWRGEKTGKEYQGPKGKDENGNQTVGDQRVDEDLIALYPDKMENAITSMQKRLSDHLSGENTLNYHDSSITMLLDLYRLWGFEPNELLKEVDFRPRTESESVRIATEEGLVGRQFTKLVLGLQGKLFTSVEGSSKLTERLESLPGFYTLTRDILSDISLGAEFKEGDLRSAIEINDAQVQEMLKEFARVYPQYAKYILVEGGTNVDEYVKLRWQKSGKGKNEKKKWKKDNNWPEGKDIPPEVSAEIKAKLFAIWRTEAINDVVVRRGFVGEDSVKSEVYNVLMEENMRKKKILEARPRNPETGLLLPEHKMPIDPETGERMFFSTPEMIDIEARRTAKDIKFRFIEFLNEKAQEILIDEAERFEQEAGLKTLTPEQRQAKRRAERKAAVEAQQKALAEPEILEPETPVVEPPAPVVEAPKPVEPPKRTIVTETTGQVTEKQRNAENLRRAIAAAEEKGNVKDVTKTQVTGGKPKMPTDYGYKRGDKQGLWIHPNPRFTIQKVDTKLYTVKESQNVNGNIIEKNHGTFGSFEAAHSVVEKNVSAQTPPPMPPVATTAAPAAPKPVVTAPVAPVAPKPVTAATTPVVPPKATPQPPKPVGRPRKPVTAQETPKPVKNAIDKETERKVSQNTVKTPEQVGQAQAVVLQTGVVGASSPAVAPAVQTVLAVKDDLTLSQVQGAKGIFKSADGRFTVTKSKNGFKVRMNDHINPVIRADVQGRDIAFVNTLAEAQLAIREYEFYMRRRLESQGVNVGQILQALHPVKTPDQINGEAAQVARILNQQLSQMPNQSKPAIDNAVMQLARDALAKLGMLKQDINVYLPLAIQSGIDPSDIQGIMKFVLTKGQVRAVYTSDSNIAHVATVNATGNVIPPSTPTVTIAPTNTGVQNATGATMPSQKPTTAPIGQTAKPVLNSQQLATVQALSTFIPHSSQIALPNGRKMSGITYKNGSGYMIVQSGIGKWRVYNPAASLISVVDDEQDACNAILKDFYKR